MSILDQLSSRVGMRSNEANHEVGLKCIDNPALLAEIAEGFTDKDTRLVADCCEVFTQTALSKPEFIVPYAAKLPSLLNHKNGRVRWETMHCIALTAHLIPNVVKPHVGMFTKFIESDKSVIVRDYATDALANYAKSGKGAAREVYHALKTALDVWEGKHAGHALDGLANVMTQCPELKDEIKSLAKLFLDHPKGVVKKAAKRVWKG